VESEERLGAVAVVDQAVEGREERDAVGHRTVGRVGVCFPPGLRQADAERAEASIGEEPIRLADGHPLGLRIPALGEVPDPLLPPSPHDCDLAVRGEDLEHQPHLPGAPPVVVLAL